MTLELTLWANIIGITLGFLIALLAMSRWWVIRFVAASYIEFFRCTPALIQVAWFFYCIPIIFSVWWPAKIMGIIALSLNLAAFNAEAYRAAIQAIPRAHHDAAVALGLTPLITTFMVILPQAFILALPVLISNGIGIFQQSALVSVISIEELMYNAKMIVSANFRPIEIYTFVAFIYFILAFPISQLASYLERVISKKLAIS